MKKEKKSTMSNEEQQQAEAGTQQQAGATEKSQLDELANEALSNIQENLLEAAGQIALVNCWLEQGWDGSLEETTLVMPMLQRMTDDIQTNISNALEVTHQYL